MICLFVLAFLAADSISVAVLPKCCDYDQWLVKKNDRVFCNESRSSRVAIHAEFTLGNLTEGVECVDILNSEIVTAFHNHTFVPKAKLPVFPKCCPFDYFYNPSYHSCILQPNRTNILKQAYLKIGLPQCDIVSDELFETNNEFRVEDGALSFERTGESYPENQYCLDETVDQGFVVRVCREIEICERVRCIRKCCPDGKSFVNGSHCKDTFVHGLDFSSLKGFVGNYSDNFAIVHGYPGLVHLDRNISQYFLDEKGNFHNERTGEVFPVAKQVYCIEYATKKKFVLNHTYFGIIVSSDPPLQTKFQLNRWALIVSDVFLVVTVAFYVFTRETRKVFGKTLVSFCVAIFLLYGLIVYTTFKTNLHRGNNSIFCKIIGFSIIYLGFACFVWLQIICFDIYWTFSLHGWGSPLLITLLLVLFHLVNFLPKSLEIRMGVTKCAIEKSDGNSAEILFRSIPLTITQLVNFYLFVKTVLYCLKVKRDIKKMNQTALNLKKKKKFFARRARFILVIKLCFTMGIFYLFEVVSSFLDFSKYKATSIIEIVWDFVNSLQGLFIFLIFVCKKKNFVKCKQSGAMEKIRKVSLSSTMTSLSSVGRKISNTTRKMSKMETQEM